MKNRTIISLLIIVILFLAVARVAVLNSMSTNGIELDKMQAEIDMYRKENTILQEKVLEASSLTEVASEAASLGFVDAKNEIYLNTPLPLAKR